MFNTLLAIYDISETVQAKCRLRLFSHRSDNNQSGTKPNLVAKILATKFGGFFVIHVMF